MHYKRLFLLFEPWRPIEPLLIPGFCSIKRTGGIQSQEKILVYRWILPLALLSTSYSIGKPRAKTSDVTLL